MREEGRRIEVASVGGAKTVAHVHEVTTRFDRRIQFPLPFAIATTEEVPNLLGRLGVLDVLQVDFDGTLQETKIAAPWLDPDQRRIWDALIDAERQLVDRWKGMELMPEVRDVLKGFVDRGGQLVANAAGLVKLDRTYPGPLFIRALFELALQLEYLLEDPEPRANRYRDFQHLTKYKLARAIAEAPRGPISQRIAQSPMRAEGERRLQVEYDKVRPQFLYRDARGKQRVASNWYGMRIDELAKHVGWDGEYRTLYAICASWSHADPFSTLQSPIHWLADRNILLMVCFDYYARMLLSIADVGKVILTSEQYELLKRLGINLG